MSAYNCRAALLLQKELAKLKKLHLWGIDVDILDDNIFTWELKLSGLKETPWEGSRFEVLLSFSEEYNFKPPEVTFQTIPMHPNIDIENGTVCLDCLTKWKKNYSMTYVILSLQCMLSEPSMNLPINENAARLAAMSPNHYKQIILDCVLESQKEKRPPETPDVKTDILETPLANSVSKSEDINEERPTRHSNRYKCSYEDYLKQWKTIGTTHPGVADKYNSVESRVLSGDIDCYGGISEDTLKSRVYPSSIAIDKNKRRHKMDQLKATRMQLLKDIRGNKKGGMDLSISLPVSPEDTVNTLDVDNMEVNSLVSWIENMPLT